MLVDSKGPNAESKSRHGIYDFVSNLEAGLRKCVVEGG